MTDCATQKMRFETEAALALEAAFDGGRITSDGGLLWLERMDAEMGLCEAVSECVVEWRKRRGRHSLLSLVRQRVFQIACGYEDQNDSNFLREDPLFKVACGEAPESGADLASQPTICRLENAASRRSCHHIAEILFELYPSLSGRRTASPRGCFWTSTQPLTPPTAIRRGAITTATTASTCIILFSSSTARRDIFSRRFCGRETPTPPTPPWPSWGASSLA